MDKLTLLLFEEGENGLLALAKMKEAAIENVPRIIW